MASPHMLFLLHCYEQILDAYGPTSKHAHVQTKVLKRSLAIIVRLRPSLYSLPCTTLLLETVLEQSRIDDQQALLETA